jgi:hypothetical protein
MLTANEKEKIILDFQKGMLDIVWSFALKREGQFASYFAQVALAVGGVALSMHYKEYVFLAQVFALLILGWGASITVLTNYDYRINQAIAWALETKFRAHNDVIPEEFGMPKRDLIGIHFLHIVTFGILGLLVSILSFYWTYGQLGIPHKWKPWIILVLFILLVCYTVYRIFERQRKFKKCFSPEWQSGIKTRYKRNIL